VPTPSNDSFGLWRDLPPRRARLVDAVGQGSEFVERVAFENPGVRDPCFEGQTRPLKFTRLETQCRFSARRVIALQNLSGQKPEAVSRGPHMCVIVAASRDIASRARVFVTVGETARDRHRS
jgi:hypothetical protein